MTTPAFDFAHIAIDPQLANEGKWVKFLGGEFLIARWNNKKAEALRAELNMQLYKELQAMEEKSPEEREGLEDKFADVQAQIMSKAILLDWKNVGNGGKSMPFSQDAAYKVLTDPRYVDFFHFVHRESTEVANYTEAQKEAIKKDVKTSANS